MDIAVNGKLNTLLVQFPYDTCVPFKYYSCYGECWGAAEAAGDDAISF